MAVAYLEKLPDGVAKFTGTVPAGCSFWRLATQGRSFYTVLSDHFNCPIGSYTHGSISRPSGAATLQQALSLMSDIGYVRMEEVAAIPRLPHTPAFVDFSPLAGPLLTQTS